MSALQPFLLPTFFMDLSQQELPLTAYFTRGNKEARSRSVPHKKGKSTQDSPLVARAPKRRKSNVQSSITSPSNSSASQSKSRVPTLQLPTPATSTRKCRRIESAAETPLMSIGASLSSVERHAIPLKEGDPTQLDSGSTPLKLPQSLRTSTENVSLELSSIPLATPATGRLRTTKSTVLEAHPGTRHSNHGEARILTPRTSSRRTVRNIDDHTTLASNCHSSSDVSPAPARLRDAEKSHSVLPLSQQHSPHSTAALPCFPAALDFPDPFCTRSKVFAQQDAFALPKQYCIPSKILDGQTSDSHAVPAIPVPSSQSQYLLHLDATPKRKRCSPRIERVISSQTQEEQELTLSTPHRIATTGSIGASPGKYTRGNAQILDLSCAKPTSHYVRTLSFTPIGLPTGSPTGPSRSRFGMKEALNEFLPKPLSPSRGEDLTSYRSPSRNARMPRRSPRHDSMVNILPAHIEESLTESESESDILQLKMKCKLSALTLPSREIDQVPCHGPLVRCGSAEGVVPGVEDDSATEAESDTEILHCVAEISRKRPLNRRFEVPVSREDTPPPPVISPLVSPTGPRIAVMPSMTGATQFLARDGGGLSCPFYSSTMGGSQIPSGSLPAVVRDFIRMFPGDDSYPADFPESLRI